MGMHTVTCHTEGCANAGAPVELELSGVDADGYPWQVNAVVCGPCGQPVSDIAPPVQLLGAPA